MDGQKQRINSKQHREINNQGIFHQLIHHHQSNYFVSILTLNTYIPTARLHQLDRSYNAIESQDIIIRLYIINHTY